MKEFQFQIISAKMSLLLVRLIISIIAIEHLCPENSVIMPKTFFRVKPEQPPKKPDSTQIDLTKLKTKGKPACQENQLLFV